MEFTLEKLDMKKIKEVYLLRGYEKKSDEHYCMSCALTQDANDDFKLRLLLSKKTHSIGDIKSFITYIKKAGMEFTADVLQSDFDKFYNNRGFQRIKG